MIKKLTKHGNSLAILIDKPILELLNITKDTHINLKTDGTNIIIEPIRAQTTTGTISDNPQLQKIYEDIVAKYDDAFRKLAQN
jgi:antitoxin component of MazEF toxin-antitoxin module